MEICVLERIRYEHDLISRPSERPRAWVHAPSGAVASSVHDTSFNYSYNRLPLPNRAKTRLALDKQPRLLSCLPVRLLVRASYTSTYVRCSPLPARETYHNLLTGRSSQTCQTRRPIPKMSTPAPSAQSSMATQVLPLTRTAIGMRSGQHCPSLWRVLVLRCWYFFFCDGA
jgi:hypothetical protein